MIDTHKTYDSEIINHNPRYYYSQNCQSLNLNTDSSTTKNLTCSICGNVFSVPKARRNKDFVCNICKSIQEEAYYHFPERICKVCGKPFSHDWRKDKKYIKKIPLEFCSKSCANSREKTLESRERTRNSAKDFFEKHPEAHERSQKGAITTNKKLYGKDFIPHDPAFCKHCGKRISWKSKTGFCKVCLNHTVEGRKILTEIGKRLMDEGKIKPWMSQADLSYPEKFWIKVLNNNKISYSLQVKEYPYRLDFKLEKNNKMIDLEIDGGQHQNEKNVLHDIERDSLLQKRGYIVYRVAWNEINSKKGSHLMKDKIDKFLEFYRSL